MTAMNLSMNRSNELLSFHGDDVTGNWAHSKNSFEINLASKTVDVRKLADVHSKKLCLYLEIESIFHTNESFISVWTMKSAAPDSASECFIFFFIKNVLLIQRFFSSQSLFAYEIQIFCIAHTRHANFTLRKQFTIKKNLQLFVFN